MGKGSMELEIAKITIADRHRKDVGDIGLLADSIRQLGLLQPIGITPDHTLIFGHRRVLACQRLGRKTIPARVIDVPAIVLAEHAENEVRKEFTKSERVAIAQAIEAELGNRRGQRTDLKNEGQEEVPGAELPENFPEVRPGQETRQAAAKKAGFGNETTYRQAKTVVTQGTPELVGAMDQGTIAVSTAAKLAVAPVEIQYQAIADPKAAIELAKAASAAKVKDTKKIAKDETKAHVTHNSGENEWYTPAEYIEAARQVLGEIDLDPCSTVLANTVVKAKHFFTLEDDGLSQAWCGRVWMNPPYAAALVGKFVSKLIEHLNAEEVTESGVLVNNATETAWFQELAGISKAVAFPKGRIKYWHPDNADTLTPLQGQAVFYSGPSVDKFRAVFGEFGCTAVFRP